MIYVRYIYRIAKPLPATHNMFLWWSTCAFISPTDLSVQWLWTTCQKCQISNFSLMGLKFVKINYFLFQVHVPCRRGVHQEFCRRYDYPPVDRSNATKHKTPPSPSSWRFPTGMGKEALLPGSIEPGKFYDFIGDKEAFNDLGLKEGEVNRKIDRSSKCCSNLLCF